MERVVVTGLGLVSSLGIGVASAWPRLIAGETGIAQISYFDARQVRLHGGGRSA